MTDLTLKITKRRSVIATIWVLSILTTGLFVNVFASVTSTTPWTLNAPPTSTWDYFVSTYSNGTFYVESADWQTWTNYADCTSAINAALALVPVNGGVVRVQGNNVHWNQAAGSTILMRTNNTLILDHVYIKKGAGANEPIIANIDQTNGNYGMSIIGIAPYSYLDGSPEDATCRNEPVKAIYIQNNNNVVGYNQVCHIENIKAASYGNVFDVQTTGANPVEFYHCQAGDLGYGYVGFRIGFNIFAGDSYLINCGSNAYREALYMVGGTLIAEGNYFGGGGASGSERRAMVYLKNDKRSQFSNNLLDAGYANGIFLENTNYTTWTNTRIRFNDFLDANNTWSGIVLENSFYNQFGVTYVGRWDLDVVDYLKYGYYENGTSNWNQITNFISNVGTAGIITSGANTNVIGVNGTTEVNTFSP